MLSKIVTATALVHGGAARVKGFYVASTSSGTLVFRDGSGSGEAKSGTITPAVGWHDFPVPFPTGIHVTVGGTINITLSYEA